MATALTGIDNLNFDKLTPTDLFGGSSSTSGKMQIPEDWGSVTPGSVFGTSGLPSGYNPVTGGTNSSSWTDLLSSISGLGGGSGTTPAPSGGGIGDWLKNFLSGSPANGGASGLAPYLAAGAGGIAMAKDAQNQATKEADKLGALGKPFTDAGQQLLKQFQSGKLRPDQQAVVDQSSKFSSDLLASASPLGKIAQQAFADYNAGKLPAADELKLSNQVAAQKQQVRQMLQSSGISDSSVLAAQDQQIDNQAMIARQDLQDKRFATGNQAYDQWLKTTTEGQQLKLQGQQFASASFEQMLNDSLGLASEGMQPAMEAIQLKIQSDAELSQTVSELLGNLASAYSYAAAGPKTVVANGGGGGAAAGGGGSAQSGLSQIISGIGGLANTIGSVGKLFGFKGAGGQAAESLAGNLGSLAGGLGGVGNLVGGIKNKDPLAALSGASSIASALAGSSLTSGTALGGFAASSGLAGLAAPLAIGMAATKIGNHALGNDVKQPLVDAWAKSVGLQPVTIGMGGKAMKQGGREQLYSLPNGKWITFSQAYDLAERAKNGDQAGYNKLMESDQDYWAANSGSKFQPIGGWDKYLKEHPGSTRPKGIGG